MADATATAADKPETGNDKPPRSRKPRSADDKPKPTRARADAKMPTRDLEKRLTEFFQSFSLIFLMSGDGHCATVIAEGAEPLAHAWTNLAKESPGVRKALNRMMTGSAWGEVVMASMAVVIPIAQHHSSFIPDIPIFGGEAESDTDQGDSPPSAPAPAENNGDAASAPATREAVVTMPRVPNGAAVSQFTGPPGP